MNKSKGMLQNLSVVLAVVSFVLALTSGVLLYLRPAGENIENPISASLMASTFFFICVGIVFYIMGKADLPSFKFDNSEGK